MNYQEALKIFELNDNFTTEELKKAYHAKVKIYHEANYINSSIEKQNKAQEMMKMINGAYKLLKEKVKPKDSSIYCIGISSSESNNVISFSSDDQVENGIPEDVLIESDNQTESSEEILDEEDSQIQENLNRFAKMMKNCEKLSKEEHTENFHVQVEKVETNELIIKNLIKKFLKMFYRERQNDLNVRAKSEYEKTYGWYYWDKKKIARHLVSKDYTKILLDKYDIELGIGKSENIPLAFYFDLSPSMKPYEMIISQISKVLLDNGVKVLYGFNSLIYYQINSISKTTTIEDIREFLNTKKATGIVFDQVNRLLDDYLIEKRCERCVVFSDYDSYSEICNLSQKSEVYLFYCQNYCEQIDENFNGVFINISNEEELMKALVKISRLSYYVLKSDSRRMIRRRII